MTPQVASAESPSTGPRQTAVPGFRLRRRLGQRPLRATYLGEQLSLGRPVLLRVWNCEREWSRELLSDASLSHPACLATYEVGELPGGRIYQASEHVNGHSLAQWMLSPFRAAWPDILSTALQICSAVAHAHGRGIFHGTLSPRSIWFSNADLGGVRVCDFGQRLVVLADATDNSVLAPETARDGHVDTRSDVYGIGLLLYEMMAGEPPYVGSDRTGASRGRADPVPTLSRYDVPAVLQDLVLRCLSEDPSGRPGAVEELADGLRRMTMASG